MLTPSRMKSERPRLDEWLVATGVFESREQAKREMLAGRVYEKASGAILDKPGARVPAKGLEIRLAEVPRFVSRAGEKLQGFLNEVSLSMHNRRVLDVGSSTGGFTDCALKNGARSALCVDVGSHQLHEKLRLDPRVRVFENTDIRHFPLSDFATDIDFVLIDVSFISVRLFLSSLLRNLPDRDFILLFKPQFEAGRDARRIRGILQEPDRTECLQSFREYLAQLAVEVRAERDSLLKGFEGNQETLFYFRSGRGQSPTSADSHPQSSSRITE